MSPTIPIKQINRNQIYRYIYKHTKVSQQDISSDLKLSMPTINQNLNALRSMGQSNFLCEGRPDLYRP